MTAEERVGRVVHGGHHGAEVVAVHLESGELRVGDLVHIRGRDIDVIDRVTALEVDGQLVDAVQAGEEFEVSFAHHLPPDAEVFLVHDEMGDERDAVLRRFPGAGRIPPAKR